MHQTGMGRGENEALQRTSHRFWLVKSQGKKTHAASRAKESDCIKPVIFVVREIFKWALASIKGASRSIHCCGRRGSVRSNRRALNISLTCDKPVQRK